MGFFAGREVQSTKCANNVGRLATNKGVVRSSEEESGVVRSGEEW